MLKIQNVSKTYRNGQTALYDVNLEIKKGEFTAILGPNGAGKTTLINILAGNVKKSSGHVRIGEYDLDEHELDTKKVIGIVPQEISFDSFFTVNEVLNIQSGYFGIRKNQEYIDELLHNLALYDKKHANTKALSGGMRRRLLIAKALVHKPKIFILDEPTAGVDIELRHQLYTYLKKMHKEEGKTIILTTHYLEEAEELCKRTIILNHGKIIADSDTRKLINSLGEDVQIEFLFPETELKKHNFDFLGKYQPEQKAATLKITLPRSEIGRLFIKFNEQEINYTTFNIKEPNLEDVFLKLTST